MRIVAVHHCALPLHTSFTTAAGTIDRREIVLIGVTTDVAAGVADVDPSTIGWGEAAPYPGLHRTRARDVFAAAVAIAEATAPPRGCPEAHRLARAAVAAARIDAVGRASGVPTARAIGNPGTAVAATLAIGITDDLGKLRSAVSEAVEWGYRRVKLKIRPGWDETPIAAVTSDHPGLDVGADANGSYTVDDAALDRIDRLGLAFVEQPVAGLGAMAAVRRRLRTPVAADEPIGGLADLHAVLAYRAADIAVIKPGRLGVGGAMEAIRIASLAGLGVRVSGLVESAVGRAHNLAVAARPDVTDLDIAPGAHFFVDDVAAWQHAPSAGRVAPAPVPGIGVVPDPAALHHLGIATWEARS